MPNPTSNQVLHPTNPPLVKDVNIPRSKGQTRVLPDGSLLYREPITGEEVPAVRLEDIRPRLVQEASKKLSYRFPKKRGYEDTNVTAFVKKDYNFGPKRENRPDRLFQIRSDGTKGEKPDGYVMDRGRIVLDAFDHGLRNFGNQLPIYVSSELEGHDIEDYLRRNREISVYDLVARAPNGYYRGQPETKNKKTQKDERAREWHDGPPRVGTFSMRATRFRLSAGCLSWEKKDGTVAKNQRILDVIPAQYKDQTVNSTKGWRDLNKAEIKRIKDGAMRKPQQGPKAKRAAQAEIVLEKKVCSVEKPAEGKGFFEDGEGVQYQDGYAWIGASIKQDQNVWLELPPEGLESSMPAQVFQAGPQSSNIWQTPTIDGETSGNTRNEPSTLGSTQPRKRSRGHSDAYYEESRNVRAPKRARITNEAQDHGTERGYPRIRTSRMGRPPQQRRPAPEPPYIARGTSPVSMHPAIGSSTPVSQGNVDQFCNSSNSANEVSMLPTIHNTYQPPTYASPLYESRQILPLDLNPKNLRAALPRSREQSHPQRHPHWPNTTLKRKRSTPSSTTSPPNGPHPNKPAAALQPQTPINSALEARSITPNPIYQLPSTPYHRQANPTHTLFSPPPGSRNIPESSQYLPASALEEDEESWIAETFPVVPGEEEEGVYAPPMINSRQEETFATGLADMDAYLPAFDSRGYEFHHPTAEDWHRGQWDGARWTELDAGWLV